VIFRKSWIALLPERLTWIDTTNRDEHYFLEEGDRCLFFGDFHGGKGWSGGVTNQLIMNFKRTPGEIQASANARQLLHYKNTAIAEIAAALRKVFSPDALAQRTFVPIPTSKVHGDPDYCDRLERTLNLAFRGYGADIRLALHQTASTEPDHRSGANRISYDDLLSITEIDPTQLITPLRAEVVLFDDVLTSGKHYKVAKTRILELFPGKSLLAIFVARCIHASPFDAP
jgi:hypothetical protein